MEFREFLNLLKKKRATVLSIVAIFTAIAVIIVFVQPLKYGSKSKLLVVQNYAVGTDSYAVSRSNEYLSGILAQVISSNSFFNEVMKSGFNIDKSYFGDGSRDQMKRWQKTVLAKSLNDTGMIIVNVYHPDKSQAKQINEAIDFTIKMKHTLYHGGGNKVNIKIIDEPIVSAWPVNPNIVINIVLGILFGLAFSFSYIYLFPEEKNDFKLWRKKKSNKEKEIKYKEMEKMIDDIAEEFKDDSQKHEHGHTENNISKIGDINNVFGHSNTGN